ncbi:MAG: hypothetical protein JWO06_2680, partial [Bacteroidota bacterium]|nr:hypothetical protein [Bacteroidota bacterium]
MPSLFSLIIYIIIAAIGFTMVFLYRGTKTTAQIFKPDPNRVKKLFMIVLATATVVTLVLSYLTEYQLKSTAIPDESSMKFQDFKS